MDLINYSALDFVLNAHPDKIALNPEAKSAIQSIIEANENLTRVRDQLWNMITASIHDLDRDKTTKIRGIESE